MGYDKHDFKNTVKDLLIVVVIGSCCRLFSLTEDKLAGVSDVIKRRGLKCRLLTHRESLRGC